MEQIALFGNVQPYKIGITEAGDAGIDLTWVKKLDGVDGAIVITKKLAPGFCDAVLANRDKLIVHATITGHGGSILEPNVPKPRWAIEDICELVDAGFPIERVVIRIDPIIPTPIGIQKAENVFTRALSRGFRRFRISILDMYPHVKARFKAAGLALPYGDAFSPSAGQSQLVDDLLGRVKKYFVDSGLGVADELRLECCAEPQLTEAVQSGCVSAYDLELLGLNPAAADSCGYQRQKCLCYSGKTELLEHKVRCPNGCLYCYWRND